VSALTFPALVSGVRERRGTVPLNLLVLRAVDSTNRLARRIREELGEDELPLPWSALIAFEQTAGRGRQGRSWASPPGQGVYATVLGRLPDPARLPLLPLAVAARLAEALAPHLANGCRLKWPNDLMTAGGKVGGVLVEALGGASRGVEVLVGFGVNHGQEAGELVEGATSLAMSGARPPLAALAVDLAAAVAEEVRSAESAATTLDRWLARSQHAPGDPLRCRVPGGIVEGTYRGLAPDGRLRLEVGGREELLVSAEVEPGAAREVEE
jgi:BirA family biotin operon repressor/biotin-[acetyl-CoA-carboxylase] ligase